MKQVIPVVEPETGSTTFYVAADQKSSKIPGRFYDLCAIVIILLAFLLHLYLISIPWPQTNSDEGTMGLMARDILYHGKFVVMYYGQDYMGSLQAWLGALFFTVFGPTVFALRLGVVLELVFFLIVMYVLSCLLYSRVVGIVSLLILSLGPSQTLFNHVLAGGGPNEVLLFGALLSLLAAHLALTARIPLKNNLQRYRRYAGFALWGLLAGFALWSDPLVFPFVLMPGLLILVCCWHERKSLAPLLITLCFLIGFSPYIIFFATVPREHVKNRLISFSSQLQLVSTHEKIPTVPLPLSPPVPKQRQQPIHSTGQASAKQHYYGDYGLEVPPPTLTQQLLGLIVVALPMHGGAMALCPIGSHQVWPISWQSSAHVLQCSAIHAAWGLGDILLWGIAVWLAIRWLLVCRRQTCQQTLVDESIQGQTTIQAARLMMLAATGLLLLLYGASAAPAMVPWSSSRYLVALRIATPGLIIALWDIIDTLKRHMRFSRGLVIVVRYATLLFVIGTLTQGTLATLNGIGDTQQKNVRQALLITQLENRGIHRFYTDYWTCDSLAFESEEQLTCAVLDEKLQPDLDRDWSYRAQVYSDSHAAFVFPNNSEQLKTFMQRITGHKQVFKSSEIEGYMVYRPVS